MVQLYNVIMNQNLAQGAPIVALHSANKQLR